MTHRRVHDEAWPKAHHLAPPDLAIRQRQLCSGARPSAQPYVTCATRSESLPITSRAGNDRNASTGVLDFMHGRMTRRHEGFVSTMLTESGLSIALRVRHFKGLVPRNAGCKPTSTAFRGFFVLTAGAAGLSCNDESVVREAVDSCGGKSRRLSDPRATRIIKENKKIISDSRILCCRITDHAQCSAQGGHSRGPHSRQQANRS